MEVRLTLILTSYLLYFSLHKFYVNGNCSILAILLLTASYLPGS